MANSISKIKIPSGTVYEVKDDTSRGGITDLRSKIDNLNSVVGASIERREGSATSTYGGTVTILSGIRLKANGAYKMTATLNRSISDQPVAVELKKSDGTVYQSVTIPVGETTTESAMFGNIGNTDLENCYVTFRNPSGLVNSLTCTVVIDTAVAKPVDNISKKLDKPSTEGTAGQVVASDGNGGTEWVNIVEVSAEATQLPEGSSPTVTSALVSGAPKLTFGIPAGATGRQGDKGDRGDTVVIAKDYADLTFPVYAGKTYCYYDNKPYVAKVDIATTEAWTAAHWDEVSFEDEISDLKSALKHLPSNIDRVDETVKLNTDITEPVTQIIKDSTVIAEAVVENTETQDGEFNVAGIDPNMPDDISWLKSNKVPFPVSQNPKYGSEGQVLSTLGDGNTEWVDPVTPSSEAVMEAVFEWLDEHPEATTSVADHSLTHTKLVNGTLNFVTPEMFGAVGDGETDDSAAINSAVAAGYYILFSAKTYLIANSIEITHGDVTLDFNGASILCTANNFIEASSEFDVTVYSGSYSAGSRNGFGTGTGLTLITSNELAQFGRRYYMCGTTCYSDNGELNLSLPYAITACEMKKQSAPLKNITIKNIGSYANANSAEWNSYTITFSGVADAMIEHCNLGPGNYNYVCISLTRCSNITIRDCVIGTFNNVSSNTYGIQVSACSFTTVDTCRMYSAKWHCITTGFPETAMYTYVLNSVLSLATNAATPSAYSDHGNALGTKLQNCKITGYVTIADGVVDHCEMHSHKSGYSPQIILFAWVGNKVKPNFTVSNIRVFGSLIITFSSDNQEPQGNVSLNINRVHISNIMGIGDNLMIQFPEMAVNSSIASMDYGVIDVDGYTGRFDRLQIFKTVRVSHSSIASISYRATAGYDAMVAHTPKLILSDCSVYSFTNSAYQIELQAVDCSFRNINYGTELPGIIEMLNCYISSTSAVTLKAATLFLLANCVFNCPALALEAQTGKVSGTNMTTLAADASGFQSDIYKEANAASYAQKTTPNGAWSMINI